MTGSPSCILTKENPCNILQEKLHFAPTKSPLPLQKSSVLPLRILEINLR